MFGLIARERKIQALQPSLRLRFDQGEVRELLPPHDRIRFAGERVVQGELIDGLTHDFNLIWRRNAVTAELLHRPLVGPMLFFTAPGVTWAIHLLAGQAAFDQASGLPPMWTGDTAILMDSETRGRYALEGGGEVLAIKLQRLQQAPGQ